MTQEDIIEMARQTGLYQDYGDGQGMWVATNRQLEKFVKLVAAKEREECAKLCDQKAEEWANDEEKPDYGYGAAIRARGKVC